jgi:hypothetical protein
MTFGTPGNRRLSAIVVATAAVAAAAFATVMSVATAPPGHPSLSGRGDGDGRFRGHERYTTGGVLANFTRVETFGARQTHWVSATIDPSDPNLFEFEPRIVAANVG